MKILGTVSSEGGPFLLADWTTAQQWGGVDDSDDYERACELLSGGKNFAEIEIGNSRGIVWDAHGAGTADVIALPDRLTLIRLWFDEEEDEETILRLAALPIETPEPAGKLMLNSDALVLLWAPEDGGCLENLPDELPAPPDGDLAIDGSSLIVPLAAGTYHCFLDELSDPDADAVRCHFVRIVS